MYLLPWGRQALFKAWSLGSVLLTVYVICLNAESKDSAAGPAKRYWPQEILPVSLFLPLVCCVCVTASLSTFVSCFPWSVLPVETMSSTDKIDRGTG